MAAVEIDFRYGYIDKTGRVAITPRFEHADAFTESLACVASNGHKYGFIGTAGEFIIEPSYDLSFGFHNGLAPVATGSWHSEDPHAEWPHRLPTFPTFSGNWGYIDREGRDVWQPSN